MRKPVPVKEPLIGIQQQDETGSENHCSGLEKTEMVPNKKKNPGMFLLSCFPGDRTSSNVFVQNETRWIF